jgi:outer membrane lipoprotein SlyB
MTVRPLSLAPVWLVPLLAAGCVATTTTTRTWGAPAPPPPARQGQVEWIRETVQHQEGNPAGGAAVGAIVGGLLGHAVTGEPVGTVAGAVGGAAVGASASQGSAERRFYDVGVRFDDGEKRVFRYQGASPFQVGEVVAWTRAGLQRTGPVAPASYAPPPGTPPPPPEYPPVPPPR